MIRIRKPSRSRFKLFLMLLIGALIGGCTLKMRTGTTGAFAQVDLLDVKLQRGVSTKEDVQRVLGAPSGSGSGFIPTDYHLYELSLALPREVWTYNNVELTGSILQPNVRQQFLLVFFEKEVFDGFMWFSMAGTGVPDHIIWFSIPGTGK